MPPPGPICADYPSSRLDFSRTFATDEACLAYVTKVRWPNGFRCLRCANESAWTLADGTWKCQKCHYKQSPTTQTLLHRSRHSLKTWFETAWHVCEQKNGVSALGLQRAMGFGSYHTSWEWLHRMRLAMVVPGRNLLTDEVEVDETFIGGVKPGKRGRGAAGKTLVLIAAEVRGTVIGRIRLKVIPDATGATLIGTVSELVENGSNVVTDGWAGYAGLTAAGFNHTISRHTPAVGQNLLPKAHRVASLLKRWILGTHQGAIGKDHLQAYLDEFVFRFNRRSSRSRGLLFYRLIQQAMSHAPVPKAAL